MGKPRENGGTNSEVRKSIDPSECEILTIVSGKGGSGKTIIAACLAYALKSADQRVCLIDTDFGTQGLSLFVLGRSAIHGTSKIRAVHSLYHAVKGWNNAKSSLPVAMRADRQADHGFIYDIIISNKQFYDRRLSLGVKSELKVAQKLLTESMGQTSDKFREKYSSLIDDLFQELKGSGKYDYVIVDTRGGFAELALVPAVFADSILVVTEPDPTSFHQLAKLLTNIDLMSLQKDRAPYVRGIIVNKAVDGDEPNFRALLQSQFGADFGQSWAIPLDPDTIRTYKDQLVPYKNAPETPFSSATLNAFTDIFDLVTSEWPSTSKTKWRDLVSYVENAKKTVEQAEYLAEQEAEQRARKQESMLQDALNRVKTFERTAPKLEEELSVARRLISESERELIERAESAHEIKLASLRKSMRQRMLSVVLGLLAVVGVALATFTYNSVINSNEIVEVLRSQIQLLDRQVAILKTQLGVINQGRPVK